MLVLSCLGVLGESLATISAPAPPSKQVATGMRVNYVRSLPTMQEGILSLQVLSNSNQGFRGRLHLNTALQGLPISVSGSAVQNVTGEERRPAFFFA